ncbi:MAG: response regulator [Anaerovoracaceae bacterium]
MNMEQKLSSFRECFDDSCMAFSVVKVIKDFRNAPVDFIYCYVNKAMADFRGIKIEDWEGKNYNSMDNGMDVDWLSIYYGVAYKGNRQTIVKYIEERDIYIEAQCFQVMEGYCASIVTDVTEEKKSMFSKEEILYYSNISSTDDNVDDKAHRQNIIEKKYIERQKYKEEKYNNSLSSCDINLTKNLVISGKSSLDNNSEIGKTNIADELFKKVAAHIWDDESRKEFLTVFNVNNIIYRYYDGHGDIDFEYKFDIGNGGYYWFATHGRTMKNPITSDIETFIYTEDITSRKDIQAIIDGIVKLDYDYVAKLDAINDTYVLYARTDDGTPVPPLNATGYEQMVREYANEYVIEKDIEKNIRELSYKNIFEQLKTKDQFTIYVGIKEAKGKIGHKKIQVSYLDRDNKKIIITRTDVTELVDMEKKQKEDLSNALNAAMSANKAKSEFLSNMSHEIRTPMNAIIGMSALAAQYVNDPDQVADYISKVGISARFLLSLVNDILDMSRIESGKVFIKEDEIPFEEFVNGINVICNEQAEKKGVYYESIIGNLVEEYYVGDAMKLQQILVNIISNAIKFTKDGGKVQFIIQQMGIKNGKANMKFIINDTGIGIKSSFIPKLYEPFAQEYNENVSTYGGTGLGLAICKNLVDLMGGTISVNSIEGVGTEFNIMIRLGLSQETKKRHAEKSKLNFEKLHSLIVDDDVIVCQQTQNIMNDLGIKAEWVNSGEKAIAIVKKKTIEKNYFDLILIDWKMPDMDGIETTREIRKIVGPEVTIIIMTAFDWVNIEGEAKQAGVNLLINKPIFKSSFSHTVENIYNKKNQESVHREAPKPYDFSGKRVLLVEDHLLNVEVAKRLLESKNMEVIVAENGLVGIEEFAKRPIGYYDAILMDIRMPVMDGITATKSIRQMKKKTAKTIPIIAMSANAFDEDVEKSKTAGMNAHLAKPIEPKELFRVLEQHVGGGHGGV